MKLYLDDERPAPRGWVRVDNVKDCIKILVACWPEELSLDHDLGSTSETGYDVLLWIERTISPHSSIAFRPPKIHIHTSNPSARLKMQLAVEKIERLAKEHFS